MNIKEWLYHIKKDLSFLIINPIRYNNVVKTGKKVRISSNCKFEGNNRIGDNTTFLESSLGYGTYIGRDCIIDKTIIGRFSCIGHEVKIIRGRHPIDSFVSLHPMFYSSQHPGSFVSSDKYVEYKCVDNYHSVIIGNDVWIGYGAMILEGVSIGDGAVIAAGAVVTKSVDPYSIVAGVPAKPIRNRFPESDSKFLLSFKWWDKDIDWIKENAESFENIKKLQKMES